MWERQMFSELLTFKFHLGFSHRRNSVSSTTLSSEALASYQCPFLYSVPRGGNSLPLFILSPIDICPLKNIFLNDREELR